MKKKLLTLSVAVLLLSPLLANASYMRVNFGSFFRVLVGRYFAVYNTPTSAPAACSPTDVSGLKAWYKADGLSLSDGDPVNTWTDSSGNSNDAPKIGTAPIFKTGILNGKPVVRFNSTGIFQKSFTLAQPTTFILVTAVANASGGEGAPAYDGANNLTANLYPHYSPMDFTPFSSGFGTAVSTNWNNPNVIVVEWNGASSIATVNGTLTNESVGTPDPGGVTIGSWGNGNNIWSGDMAELYIYDSALGTSARQAQEDCMGTKYGITISH